MDTNDQGRKQCEHQRADYRTCPHCMGIGSDSPKPEFTVNYKPSTMADAREWWIIRSPIDDKHTLCAVKPEWKSIELGFERIHVIEHSAYDAIAKELAEAMDDREALGKVVIDLGDQLASAQVRIAELEDTVCSSCAATYEELTAAKLENQALAKMSLARQAEFDVARQEIERLTTHFQVTTVDLVQAQQRIEELEADNLLALDIADKFANERDELKAREQKLVAALKSLHLELVAGADGIEYRCTCNRPLTECKPMYFSAGDRLYRVSYFHAEQFEAALKAHRGEGM